MKQRCTSKEIVGRRNFIVTLQEMLIFWFLHILSPIRTKALLLPVCVFSSHPTWSFVYWLFSLAAHSRHYGHVTAVAGRPPVRRASDFWCRHNTALPPDLCHNRQDAGRRGISGSSARETLHGSGVCTPGLVQQPFIGRLVCLPYSTGCEGRSEVFLERVS